MYNFILEATGNGVKRRITKTGIINIMGSIDTRMIGSKK